MRFFFLPSDMQLDLMNCSSACFKTIAKYYEKYYSVQHLKDKCGITCEGVSFLHISYRRYFRYLSHLHPL